MSSLVLSSQSVIITTAMAVSGAVILLSLCKIKNLPSIHHLPVTRNLPNSSSLRSCLSSGKLKGNSKNKKKKRVKFAEDVKKNDSSNKFVIRTKKVSECCEKMPANRAALYHGILRDRVYRIESY
ncbi:hypothetical protein vseg_012998 [Gypsophila vaccaria]